MRRNACLLLALLTLTGCEEQEAVPLSRSIPMALAVATAAAALLVIGWRVLARRRPDPAVRPREAWRRVAAAVLVVPAALVLVWFGVGIVDLAVGWRETRFELFSWEETVVFAWVVLVPVCLLVLAQLRAAWAVLHGRRWGELTAAGEGLLAAGIAIANVASA